MLLSTILANIVSAHYINYVVTSYNEDRFLEETFETSYPNLPSVYTRPVKAAILAILLIITEKKSAEINLSPQFPVLQKP